MRQDPIDDFTRIASNPVNVGDTYEVDGVEYFAIDQYTLQEVDGSACVNCVFNGKQTCAAAPCGGVVWVTPLTYITQRLKGTP